MGSDRRSLRPKEIQSSVFAFEFDNDELDAYYEAVMFFGVDGAKHSLEQLLKFIEEKDVTTRRMAFHVIHLLAPWTVKDHRKNACEIPQCDTIGIPR